MSCILVRPEFDTATYYTYRWAEKVKKLFPCIDLPKEKATRDQVETVLRNYPRDMLVFFDHGNKDCLVSQDRKCVINFDNVELLANREVYTLACLSAKSLGIEAHKKGCLAYWGYTDVVSFTTDALDEFEKAFLHGLKLYRKGHSWKECLEKTKEFFTELVNKLVSVGKYMAAVCMENNRDILVCYTKEEAPEQCPFRRFVVWLLGPKLGYRIPNLRELLRP